MKKVICLKKILTVIMAITIMISSINFSESYVEANTSGNVYQAEGYEVTFNIDSTWSGAYNTTVTIKNTGNKKIEDWHISFPLTNEITNIWNANVESYVEGIYIIGNATSNQDIEIGSSVSFGFTAKGDFVKYPQYYSLLGEVSEVKTDGYTYTYTIESDWGTGFNGNITITNKTDSVIEDWSIEFNYSNEICNIWNAVIADHSGSHYMINNATYNQNIAAESSISIGFTVQSGIPSNQIENFVLKNITINNSSSSGVATDDTSDSDEDTIDDTTDTDGDYVLDYIEDYYGSDKTKSDTDEDGLSDYDEIYIVYTDPTLPDTDGDGINDIDEDIDEDGLTNQQEYKNATDLTSADTDSDGMSDYDEIYTYTTSPITYDTDGDGAGDGWEIKQGYNALTPDTTFAVKSDGEGENVSVSVSLNLSGEQIDSLNIEEVDNSFLINSDMAGYIGSAFNFTVDGKIEAAVISFEFDESILIDKTVVPTIYYLNEETQLLEKLDTTINGNIATATVEHFSTYLLLDKTAVDKVYFADIKTPEDDSSKDSNADGISDYYTELLCSGTLTSGTGVSILYGVPYDDFQASADFDGDGLKNGEEIIVTSYGNTVYAKVCSSPRDNDTDYDGIRDDNDLEPNSNNFNGILYTKFATSHVAFTMNYRWFFSDSTKYNQNLSVLSSLLSSSIYHDNLLEISNSNLNSDVDDDIENILTYFGMNSVLSYKLSDDYSDNDISEIAIGNKTVTFNNETKTILAIVVRGTNGTIEEWSSNFDIGSTDEASKYSDWTDLDNHKGFDVAATRILKTVNKYIDDRNLDSSSLVYWVTGHSRGAAIANIIGAKLADKGEKAFTYTFASPNTTTDNYHALSYESIFNIVNKDDFVPYLPMNGWGFVRYGRTASCSIAENYEREWEKLTKILDYNPNTIGMNKDLLAITSIASDRNECYEYTCTCHGDGSNDTITITNYGISKKSREGAINKIPSNALSYCIITRYDGGLISGWNFDCCQTPEYFMQILAAIMAKEISPYRFAVELNIADRYEGAKTAMIFVSISGVEHPHYTESYYLLSKHLKHSDFIQLRG